MQKGKLHVLSPLMILTFLAMACSSAAVPTNTPTPIIKSGEAPISVKPGWELDWGKTLAAAKQEGRIVIHTVIDASTRAALSDAFSSKYNLALEWVPGRGGEMVEKVAAERRAALFLADLYIGGATSATTSLKPMGFLDPLKPLLVLPEVTDPKLWYDGGLFFTDKERQYVACPVLTASNNYTSINTDIVKPGELKSYRDLLDPRWKGKIIMNDPTVSGAGSRWFAVVADKFMDLAYMREFVKNEPVITRDQRLQVESLARGKYAIAIGPQTGMMAEFIRVGAPVKPFVPQEGAWLGGGGGLMAYFNKAPRPNAAKIFANWFLSKEGQTVYSKTAMAESARLDVPTDHLNKGI